MKINLRSISFPVFLLAFMFLSYLGQAQNCQARITAGGNTTICFGGSVKLTASAGQSYLWSTGETTQSIFATASGSYSVAVTSNGCTASAAPVSVTALGAPDAALLDTLDNFTNCTYTLTNANFNLTVENDSKTKATNTSYTIEWGDGQSNIFGSNFTSASHTYTLPGSFQLKLTVTNAAGCTSSKTYTVFNGSNPSFGVASQGNTNDCAPATFTFDIINTAGNTPSTVYTFQFDDGTPAMTYTHSNLPKSITHTFLKPATGKPGNAFTLTAFATNPCGTTPATVGGIRISSTPKADFTMNPDSISCVNTPVTLTDLSESGFNANTTGQNVTSYLREWKISPATGWNYVSGGANAQMPIVNFTQTGTYTIRLIVTPRGAGVKCQADSTSQTITIQPEVKAAFKLAPINDNCAPVVVKTINQSQGIGLKYLWKVAPANGVTFTAQTDSVSAQPQFNFTKGGSYKISLTITNLCGQVKTADTTITIQQTPVVTLPGAKSYCLNQTVKFETANADHAPVVTSATPVTAYHWSVLGNGFRFVNGTSAGSKNPEILFSQAGTFRVLFQAANACGLSPADTQTVIITPMPQVSAGADTTFCAQTATIFLKGFPAGGTWSGNPAVTADGKFNAAKAGTFLLTYTYGVGNCQLSDQKEITVNALPVASATTHATICPGGTASLNVQGNAVRYEWYDAAANGTLLHVGTNYTTSALQTTQTFYVSAFNAEGCALPARLPVTVTVNPVVAAATISDVTLCGPGNTATLSATGSAKSYEWYDAATNGTLLHTGATFTTPALAATTSYYVLAISNEGCRSFTRTKATVTVLPALTTNSIGGTQAICAGEIPGQLTGSNPGGGNGTYQYTWASSTDSVNFQTIAGATGKNYQPAALQQTTWYRRTTISGVCSENTDLVKVTVFPKPTIPVVAKQTICYGSSATIILAGQGQTFQWFTTATGGQSFFTGAVYQTPALTATTDFYVQATSAQGCISPSRGKVSVTVLPQI
ncbi:MAG TPA: PKD domain-containing protein, partial [Adhaeribacter sp.]|nr:PKD domain-containing protein [Adhaeribacter sp.]